MSPPNSHYWLSSEEMTVIVEINHIGVIINTPPVVHRFIGQPLDNLVFWMQKQPGFLMKEIDLDDFDRGVQ